MPPPKQALVLSLIVLALFLVGIFLFHYLPDDTFITLRYARNVMRGDGFVFNPGVRLEGYTNFLWLIIVTLAGTWGAPLIISARTLSLVFSIAVLLLSFAAAGRHAAAKATGGGWSGSLACFLPPLLLASSAPFLVWSLSGTEIPLYTFLLLAGFYSLARGSKPAATFVLFGVLGLVRPEGLVFYALAGLITIVRSRSKTAALRAWFGVLIVFYAPYLVWKQLYFGSVVPNTFYAKTGPPRLMARNGGAYLVKFFFSYGYLLAIGLLLNRKRLRHFETVILPVLFIIVHWLSVFLLGGDWMPHFRFLVATMPLIMLLLAGGIAELGAATSAEGERRAGNNPVPVIVILLVFLVMIPGGVRYDDFTAERTAVRAFAGLGRNLHRILPPETRIGCGSTGAIGYYTDMPIIDILGLTEAHIAREGRIVASQPGHMKTDGPYILEQNPDLLLLGNIQIHRGRRGRDKMRHKVQESEIVMQPAFLRDYEFVNIPLEGGFYLSCYKRKDYFLPLE